jgi:hypothetical protein
MTETTLSPLPRARRLQPGWFYLVLFKPKLAFASITAQKTGLWLAPLLVVTLATLASVAAAGVLRQEAAQMGEVQLPPDFQYYSPEQQARVMQAIQATSGPVFIFVFPALIALSKVWFGWLLVGGLIHLVLTLFGGRGSVGITMNVLAWASLPFAIRELVRAAAMVVGQQLIAMPGLSGFTPAGEGNGYVFLSGLLAAIDIYLIWHVWLLIVGEIAATGLSGKKVAAGVLLVILVVIGLQALVGVGSAQFSNLTIIRPFF